MNTRAKGRRNELRCRDMLKALGYEVQLAPNSTKWALQNDLFGLWDVMAVKRDEIRFVQVKTNHNAPREAREAMALWPCPREVATKEIWVFKDRHALPKVLRWLEDEQVWATVAEAV